MKKYLLNVLVGIDQLTNTVFGGDPDETISSRWGKSSGWIAYFGCRVLNLFDPDHCKKHIETDEGKDGL